MPYVKIEVTKEGVTYAQKKALISQTTEMLKQVLNKPAHLTFVVIDEVETENWGVGGELVSEIRS